MRDSRSVSGWCVDDESNVYAINKDRIQSVLISPNCVVVFAPVVVPS